MAVGEPPPPSPPQEVIEKLPKFPWVIGSLHIEGSFLHPRYDNTKPPTLHPPNGANYQPPNLHPCSPIPSYADILSGIPSKNIEDSPTNSVSIKASNFDDGCKGRVQLKPTTMYLGKPAVIFTNSDKQSLIQSMKYVLVAKFSHGKPGLATVKDYFASLNLKSMVNISVYDSKHLILECEAFEDFVKIWLFKNCMVGGFMMRLFKWREDFDPSFESSIYPVWVHLPGLPLFLYKEDTLMSVANAIGRPLALDLDNITRSKLGCATFCVEVDISRDVIDEIWIAFDNLDSCVHKKGLWQKVIFDPLPPFCNRCSHLGHPIDRCLRLDKLVSNVVRVDMAEGVGVFGGELGTGGLQGKGMQLQQEPSAKKDEQNAGLENQAQDKTDDGKPLGDLNDKESEQSLEDQTHGITGAATSGMCRKEHDTHLHRQVEGLSADGNAQSGCAQNGYEQLVCTGQGCETGSVADMGTVQTGSVADMADSNLEHHFEQAHSYVKGIQQLNGMLVKSFAKAAKLGSISDGSKKKPAADYDAGYISANNVAGLQITGEPEQGSLEEGEISQEARADEGADSESAAENAHIAAVSVTGQLHTQHQTLLDEDIKERADQNQFSKGFKQVDGNRLVAGSVFVQNIVAAQTTGSSDVGKHDTWGFVGLARTAEDAGLTRYAGAVQNSVQTEPATAGSEYTCVEAEVPAGVSVTSRKADAAGAGAAGHAIAGLDVEKKELQEHSITGNAMVGLDVDGRELQEHAFEGHAIAAAWEGAAGAAAGEHGAGGVVTAPEAIGGAPAHSSAAGATETAGTDGKTAAKPAQTDFLGVTAGKNAAGQILQKLEGTFDDFRDGQVNSQDGFVLGKVGADKNLILQHFAAESYGVSAIEEGALNYGQHHSNVPKDLDQNLYDIEQIEQVAQVQVAANDGFVLGKNSTKSDLLQQGKGTSLLEIGGVHWGDLVEEQGLQHTKLQQGRTSLDTKIAQEENKAFTLFKERIHRLRGKEPERSSSLKVIAARSISHVGRSSEKMTKLRKRIENLKYEQGRAIVLEEETYKALEEYQQQLVTYHREKRQASSPKDSTPIADASHVIEQDRTTRKGRNRNGEK